MQKGAYESTPNEPSHWYIKTYLLSLKCPGTMKMQPKHNAVHHVLRWLHSSPTTGVTMLPNRM